MAQYEYKMLYRQPSEVEKPLNELVDEGWEVISFSTTPVGNFVLIQPMVIVLLRREKEGVKAVAG